MIQVAFFFSTKLFYTKRHRPTLVGTKRGGANISFFNSAQLMRNKLGGFYARTPATRENNRVEMLIYYSSSGVHNKVKLDSSVSIFALYDREWPLL